MIPEERESILEEGEEQDFPLADPDPWEHEDFQDEEPTPGEPDAEDLEDGNLQPGKPGNRENGEHENNGAGEENHGDQDESADDSEEESPSTELKVVLHVRNGRAIAGVWRPGTDPHLETFLETGVDVLLGELPGVMERAKARWTDNPMRPKYKTPKAKRSSRENRQTSQQSQTQGQPGTEQQQSSMARLF